jgi:hypothetical protein
MDTTVFNVLSEWAKLIKSQKQEGDVWTVIPELPKYRFKNLTLVTSPFIEHPDRIETSLTFTYEDFVINNKNPEREEILQNFIKSGGKLFSITLIDVMRDGGTGMIITNKGTKYYIDQDETTLHTDYPCTFKNIIVDDNLKQYIIEMIKIYNDRTEHTLKRNKELLKQIK